MQEKIVHFLKKTQGYLSGEEISKSLNISRAGIWKHIQELRHIGYKIEAVPHLGYRLLSTPDKLFPWEIQFELGTRNLGKDIVYQGVVLSTMDEAFRLGMSGAQEGTIVCAESQTKGRGRMGRHWISPKEKGLYFSMILRPKLSLPDVAKMTLLSAVAVCEAISDVSGLDARIKWPNDLLIDGRKIAGILTELNAESDWVKFIIVGVGVNVNASPKQLPDGATSLKIELGKKFSRIVVIQEILRSFEKWYSILDQKGFAEIFKRWKELSSTLGHRVSAEHQGSLIEGEAVDLAEDGGLLIRKNSGEVIKKISGDVVLIKT